MGFLAIREKLKELKTRLDLRRAREDDGKRGELGSSGGASGQRDNRDYRADRGGSERHYRDRDRGDYYSRDGADRGGRRDYSPPRRGGGGGGGGGDYRRDSRRRSPSPRRY